MKDVELFIIIGVVVTLLFVTFIISFLLLNQKRHFNYLKEKEAEKNKFEETLLRSQLEIKEQTLQHISYELHDNLGQIASLIKIHLNTLILDDSGAGQKVEDTKELVRQLIADLKSLSTSLNSDRVSQLGLEKALENEVSRLRKTGQYNVLFTHSGSTPIFDTDTTIILFRMAQEIINNIVKHSEAKTITISLNAEENLFILRVSDDGAGFDLPEITSRAGGSGLTNLLNRAKLIKACLDINSSPGNGTRISIELPI